MKKLLSILLAASMLFAIVGCSSSTPEPTPEPEPVVTREDSIPEPRDTSKTFVPSKDADPVACELTSYAADCSSVNATNLQDWLGLDNVVYIDLRDYADYAKKHLRNFECIPYFAAIFNADANGADLPQLYSGSPAEPVATYKESLDLIHAMFPTDKTIFLMCQSGGRVSQCMTLLEKLGYDMTKIYNVGGMGQYTSPELAPYVTDNAELAINATYSFEGLTLAQ